MACVNPDGSISESAKKLLSILSGPLGLRRYSKQLSQPLFKVRSSLREMKAAGLVEEDNGKYTRTENGSAKI